MILQKKSGGDGRFDEFQSERRLNTWESEAPGGVTSLSLNFKLAEQQEPDQRCGPNWYASRVVAFAPVPQL